MRSKGKKELETISTRKRKEALQKKRNEELERDRERLKTHFPKERQTIVKWKASKSTKEPMKESCLNMKENEDQLIPWRRQKVA